MRAYLYQARGIHSNDGTSRSDPYTVIFFETFSASSRVVEDSISPMWDQTIVSGQIKIFGDAQSVLESPPPVVMEFYDKDKLVSVSVNLHACECLSMQACMYKNYY